MRIFISWSGSTSQAVAVALKEWIQTVVQAIEPFVSSEDIQKGSRWFPEISSLLEEINYCIVCITPFNVNEPWILFESGAASKRLDQARVAPLLIGISVSELTGPLSQFQATTTDREDVRKLMRTLNTLLGENKLEDTILDKSFERWWPDIEKVFEAANEDIAKTPSKHGKIKRSVPDMLEELLETTRGISRQVNRVGLSRFSRGPGLLSQTLKAPVSLGDSIYDRFKLMENDSPETAMKNKLLKFMEIYASPEEKKTFINQIERIFAPGADWNAGVSEINGYMLSELKKLDQDTLKTILQRIRDGAI